MIGCVYIATNSVDGSSYIGKSIKGLKCRARQHMAAAKRGEDWAFCRAIRKYGEEAFSFYELFVSDDNAALLDAEMEIIACWRSSGMRLYNSTDGGQGNTGWVPSDVTRKRIAAKALGRVLSDDHRAKIGMAGRGQTRPVEWRLAMAQKRREYWARRKAQGLCGHPRVITDAGRKVLSESASRRWAERNKTGRKAIGK